VYWGVTKFPAQLKLSNINEIKCNCFLGNLTFLPQPSLLPHLIVYMHENICEEYVIICSSLECICTTHSNVP